MEVGYLAQLYHLDSRTCTRIPPPPRPSLEIVAYRRISGEDVAVKGSKKSSYPLPHLCRIQKDPPGYGRHNGDDRSDETGAAQPLTSLLLYRRDRSFPAYVLLSVRLRPITANPPLEFAYIRRAILSSQKSLP